MTEQHHQKQNDKPDEKKAEKQAEKQAEPRYSPDAEVSSGRYLNPTKGKPQSVPSKHNRPKQ